MTPLRVLIIEDSQDDALLLADQLRRGGFHPQTRVVDDFSDLESALAEEWDVIVSDYVLPDFSGMDALKLARERTPDTTFLMVSGKMGEDIAVETMKAGASDYILKSNLARLVPAVERELREAEVRRERRKAEEALSAEREHTVTILESITDAFFAVDHKWRFTYVNGEGERLVGKSWRSLRGKRAFEEFPQAIGSRLHLELEKSLVEQVPVTVDISDEASGRWFSVRGYPSGDGLSVYFRDVTDRKLAEDEVARSRDELGEALDRERHYSLLLQRALLPRMPKLSESYSVAAEYVAAYATREIGGDFYDVFPVGDSLGALLIGDVAGKGLEAAAMAVTTRSTIHAFLHETSSPAEALQRANSVLYHRGPEFESFVTVFLAVVDMLSGEITYSSAGHPLQVISHLDGRVEALQMGQLPLCLLEEQHFLEHRARLLPGDKLVMYTDGISEARRNVDMLDLEGIMGMLVEHPGLRAIELAHTLLTFATEWAGGNLSDDAAVVVTERLSTTSPPAATS